MMRPRATLHEEFTQTFDIFPVPAPTTQQTRPATQASTFAAGVNGFEYGFGSATRRFQNEVYGCDLPYGLANRAVLELGRTEPVKVTQMSESAPSALLPEFAARFEPEPGRSFSYGPSRLHPPADDGTPLYWVQAKDNQAPMAHNDPPDLFAVPAPLGAGPIGQVHEQPVELMAPAARREALVFDKCQQRARLELRKAANDAVRLVRIAKVQYPNGMLGLEGPLVEQSLMYENLRGAMNAEAAKKVAHAQHRLENIQRKRDTQLPYRLLTHDSQNQTSDHFLQRKKVVAGSVPAQYTQASQTGLRHYEVRPVTSDVPYQGGFRSNQEKVLKPHHAGRAQRLHDVNSRGRAYDIISGVRTPVAPSRPDYSVQDELTDRALHPSNLSLPRRAGTAPTLTGPIPDRPAWKPSSPPKSPSKNFLA